MYDQFRLLGFKEFMAECDVLLGMEVTTGISSLHHRNRHRLNTCSKMCRQFCSLDHRFSLTNVQVLLLILCFSQWLPLTLSLNQNDIQGYLRNLDVPSDSYSNHGDYPQEVDIGPSWGIKDTLATAEKVFKYMIPKDLFHKGDITLKVTEKGKDRLPGWLQYDSASSELHGVPTAKDVGKEFYLEVAPLGSDNTTMTRDIFSVRVVEDSPHADTSAVPAKSLQHQDQLKPIKCPHGSSVTMATVIVDTDVSSLLPGQRVGLMEGVCSHLGMPTELVRLQAVGHRPMFDSLALVAGPGDVKHPMTSGAMVQWEVGCGNVYANHMPVLQQLESTAHDGSMGKSVGYSIIGWHVTNNKPQAAKRVKRAVHPHATPLHTPVPTRWPAPSSKVDMTDEYGVPPSRTIPSLASPEFPEIKPTHTEHHHHHTRGPKTHGRHHDHTTSMYERPLHPSKVVHGTPVITPTKVHMGTPVVQPVTPTRVGPPIEATGAPTEGFIRPSEEPASPGVSRSVGIIEPSMTSHEVHPTSPTDILPSRTQPLPEITTTDAIQPSATDSYTPPTKLPPIPPTPKHVTDDPVKIPEPPFPGEYDNMEPRVRGDGIYRIEVTVGDILDYQIPENNFEDPEDGNTRNLMLTLTTIDNMDLTPSFWLRLDPITQRIYGLPLPEHIGRNEYVLSAIDSKGRIANDIFEIYVRMRSGERRINHEMSMVLQLNYDKFLLDVEQRVDVARTLAHAYGDSDMNSIRVTKIERGSVVYSWTNSSLPTDRCPESAILANTAKLVNEDGSLNPQFQEDMEPYQVEGAEVKFSGTCGRMSDINTGPKDGEPPVGGVIDDGNGVITEPKTSEQDVLVTTIAPAVVIAAMLLLAALIACILYRKRRKGKLSDEDQHTFIQKGIPIILPDELDDKPDPPTKPLIMAEELPPQPPPQYPHSPSPSTPRSTHKEPLLDTDDEADHNSPLYRPPPPPMSGSLGHRGARPRTPLSQRSPPQYMSPISP